MKRIRSVNFGGIVEFEDLVVATLPPMSDSDELVVGRQPDCELVVNDSSVSKRPCRAWASTGLGARWVSSAP